jgi:hypothetical protein
MLVSLGLLHSNFNYLFRKPPFFRPFKAIKRTSRKLLAPLLLNRKTRKINVLRIFVLKQESVLMIAQFL